MKRFKILFIAVLVLALGFAMSTWDPPGSVAKTKITVTDQIQFAALAAVTSNFIEKDYFPGSGEVSAVDCSIASVNKFITETGKQNYIYVNANITDTSRFIIYGVELMDTVKVCVVDDQGGTAFLRFSKTMGNQKII